jgi:hypothetical protein
MAIKRQFIPGLAIGLIVVVGGFLYYLYDMHRISKILDRLRFEYPSISINDELNGKITNIYHGDIRHYNNAPNQAFIELNDSLKRSIMTSYSITEKKSLDYALDIGALFMWKESGSDKLYLYKVHNIDTLTFVFEIRDESGYPLK